MQRVAQHSSLYALSRFAKDTLDQQTYFSLGEYADRDRLERYRTVPRVFIYDNKTEYSTAFVDPSYYSMAMDLSDPRIQEGFRISMAAMLEAKRKTEAQGAEFLVAIMPTKHWVYAEKVRANEQATQGDRKAYFRLVDMEDALLEKLRGCFEENGIAHLHLGSTMRGLFECGSRFYPPSTNTHPNGSGYTAIARTVAERLGCSLRSSSDSPDASRVDEPTLSK